MTLTNKNIFVNSIIIAFLIFAPFWGIAATIDQLKQEITEKQTEIEILEKQAKKYQETVGQKEEAAEKLDQTIDYLDGQINSVALKIRITEKQIEKTSLSIQELELKIIQQIRGIEENKKNMAGILRIIYETADENTIELVLKYENFSDFLNQVNYTENLQKELQVKLDALTTLKLQLNLEKGNLEIEKESLKQYGTNLAAQKNILTNQQDEKERILAITRGEQKRYEKLLADTEEKTRAIQKEIFELEDKLRFTVDPSTIPPPRPGVLAWPTEGIITQYYGCIENKFAKSIYSSCNDDRGGFHNGLDIAAGLGTKIVAARDGKVVATGEAPYAYGNWVAVEHDNGLVTLYTHLSSKKVNKNDNIIQNQIVGYMGTSGLSTGSHLHFTVYAPGTFQTKPSTIAGILPIGYSLNPLDYL